MPMIELDLPDQAIPASALPALIDDLTTTLLRHRGVPDTPASRANVWTFVRTYRPDQHFVGGHTPDRPVVCARVSIVQGGMDHAAKQRLVEDVTHQLQSAAGQQLTDPDRVWVLITDVADGNWGAGGRITRLQDAQQILHADG